MCTLSGPIPWSSWLVTDWVLLLRLEPLALEHVHEVHVPAEVQLVRVVEGEAPVLEQAGERAVDDRGAHLALDVVTDDGHPGGGEPVGPLGVGGDEHRDAVDERHAGVQRGLRVVALGFLGTDGEVRDQDVGARLPQLLGDVDGLVRRLLGDLLEVLAPAVEGRASLHLDAQLGHVGEADRVVGVGVDGLAEVLAHLGRVDVEGGHELHVAHVVAAEDDVHQSRHEVVGFGVPVVLDPLDEAAGAVPDSRDGDTDGLGHDVPPVGEPVDAGSSFDGCSLVSRTWRRSPSMRRSTHSRSRWVDSPSCSMRERV